MTNKQTYISAIVLAGCAAALASTQPGAFSEGSAIGGNGWKFSYSAVAKPPLSGQHIKIQSDVTFTEPAGGPTVFHRFFADPVNRTYFGYDLVVESLGQTNSAIVKFQPLSLRGNQLPAKYASTEFRAAPLPRFPSQTFKSGQTIAVDVLENPSNGQKVVDYIQVSLATGADRIRKSGSHEGVAVAASDVAHPAPPFTILRAEGPPIQLSQYRGKILALAFIHTTCPHCQALTSVLNPIAREYAPKGVQFLECAFNTAADQAVPQFIHQFQPPFPVGWSNDSAVRSFLQFSAMDPKMFYVPHMVFIDRKGMIRSDYPGESPFFQNPETSIRTELDKILKAETPATRKK